MTLLSLSRNGSYKSASPDHGPCLERAHEHRQALDLPRLRENGIWREPANHAFVFGYPTKNLVMSQRLDPGERGATVGATRGAASFYFHIPFCYQLCAFCPYNKGLYDDEKKRRYIDALCREVEVFADTGAHVEVKGIYFGGGTPSVLPAEDIQRIVSVVRSRFPVRDDVEVTLEFHPSDLDNTSLVSALANHELPVTRLSVGVQTLHDPTLGIMGRGHDSAKACEAIVRLMGMGYPLNLDLIIGYPAVRGMDDTSRVALTFDGLADLQRAASKLPPSVTIYYLWTRGETTLMKSIKQGRRTLPSIEEGILSAAYTMERLHALGYQDDASAWYVTSPSYSFRMQNSRWSGDHYVGFGIGAYGYVNGYAYYNAADYDTYFARLKDGVLPSVVGRALTGEESLRRRLALGIKTTPGIPAGWADTASAELREELSQRLDALMNLGLVSAEADAFTLTRTGRLFDDEIAEQFYATSVLQTFGKHPVGARLA